MPTRKLQSRVEALERRQVPAPQPLTDEELGRAWHQVVVLDPPGTPNRLQILELTLIAAERRAAQEGDCGQRVQLFRDLLDEEKRALEGDPTVLETWRQRVEAYEDDLHEARVASIEEA